MKRIPLYVISVIVLVCSLSIIACGTTAITPPALPTETVSGAETTSGEDQPTQTLALTVTSVPGQSPATATPEAASSPTTAPTSTPPPTATPPTPAPQPELYVSEFSLSPNPPVKGQNVHVRIGVYNGGGAAAGPFQVKWLAGVTFSTLPPCSWDVDSLVAQGGRILECDAVAYQSPYGSLTTRAIADSENSVAESDEGNNTKDLTIQVKAPAAQPDLYISEFSLSPNPPIKGQNVHVRIGVYNGGGAAAGPFQVKWLAGVTFRTLPPCSWDVDSLVAQGGRILECDAVAYQSPYGSLTTRAIADSENSVAESDEGNNTKDLTIQVKAPAAQPDLYISEFSLSPNPPIKGQNVHVRIGVYNGGGAAAGPFQVKWLAGVTFSTLPPCSWDVDSLVAQGGRILECDAVAYQSPYGSLTTRAIADPENSVAESDEGNNTKDMTIQVLAQ